MHPFIHVFILVNIIPSGCNRLLVTNVCVNNAFKVTIMYVSKLVKSWLDPFTNDYVWFVFRFWAELSQSSHFVCCQVFSSFKKMISGADERGKDLRKLAGSEIMPAGYFYKELYDLYQYVIDTKKETNPIVICADDLQVGR